MFNACAQRSYTYMFNVYAQYSFMYSSRFLMPVHNKVIPICLMLMHSNGHMHSSICLMSMHNVVLSIVL